MKFSFRQTRKICIGVYAFFKSSRHGKEGTCYCRRVGGGSLLLEYVLVTHLWEQKDGGNFFCMVFKCLTKHFSSGCISGIARSKVFLVVAGTDTRCAALLFYIRPLISSSVHVSVLSFFPIHPPLFISKSCPLFSTMSAHLASPQFLVIVAVIHIVPAPQRNSPCCCL